MSAALLIHGFASDRNDFGRLVPLLSTRYDEVFCPDLPAHGVGHEKDKLDSLQIIAFVEESFKQLKSRHDKVDVIGFSMGGALATHLASMCDINRLILLAPANKYLSPMFLRNTIRWVISSSKAEREKKSGKMVESENTITVKEMFEDIGDGIKLFGSILKKYTIKNVSEFSKVIKVCNSSLCDIKVPTLIIWGKIDQLVPFASIKHITGYCRNDFTRTIVYPDASHLMLYSRMHYKITEDIFKFLEATEPQKLGYTKKNI